MLCALEPKSEAKSRSTLGDVLAPVTSRSTHPSFCCGVAFRSHASSLSSLRIAVFSDAENIFRSHAYRPGFPTMSAT